MYENIISPCIYLQIDAFFSLADSLNLYTGLTNIYLTKESPGHQNRQGVGGQHRFGALPYPSTNQVPVRIIGCHREHVALVGLES